jgi:di/tricarboxylate transporter
VSDITITFLIIATVVVLFVWEKLPVVIVAMGTALALYFTGVLTLQQSLSGLGDTAVIFIASLFIVSAGLEVTGVTAWAGQLLIAKAGESRTRLLVFTMLMVGGLTALISVNGAVAALLPVVVVMAVRLNRPPSQLLMPLVFAAHAGSLLALTGTPVHVLVSEAAVDAGFRPFGYFEFAIAGVPLLAGSILIVVLFGEKLLPHRAGATVPADFSKHAHTLVEQYRLADGVVQLRVRASSPYIGQAQAAIDVAGYAGITLVAVQAAFGGPMTGRSIAEGDIIIVRGDAQAVGILAHEKHLAIRGQDDAADAPGPVADTLFNRASGLAEVVIPPRSALIGRSMFPGMATESGDLIVLAVQRRGEALATGENLAPGDTLLLQGTWKALDKHLADPDVLVVDSPEIVRRQAVPMGAGAKQAIAILLGMVLLLATGLVPPVIAGLLAAGAMILTGVLTVEQSYRAIGWTTVILVGAMTPLSTAMQQTGAAELLANGLVRLVGDAGPYALLAGLFLLTGILGQLISNTATALIIIPISVVAATDLGMSPRTVLMSVTIAAAASFLTPVATPTNLMVMAPGGYRFSDYWKLGLPLMIWFFVIAVFYVPLMWPLK